MVSWLPGEFPVEVGFGEGRCPLTVLKGWEAGGFEIEPIFLCFVFCRDLGSGATKDSVEKGRVSLQRSLALAALALFVTMGFLSHTLLNRFLYVLRPVHLI